MKIIYSYIIFFLCISTMMVNAQSSLEGNQRLKFVTVEHKSIIYDSLSILPSSLLLTSGEDTLTTKDYFIDNTKVKLSKNAFSIYKNRKLKVEYRVLNLNLGKKFYVLDSIALAATDDVIKTGFQLKSSANKKNNSKNQELNYDGSFSRGFSIGNKQSLVMNSNFNLQMAGMISKDIEISAALTDANIPIQAEGNTHQLNEFDRILIRLRKDKHSLTAGDLDLKNPKSYFTRYHKKLKGLQYEDEFILRNNKKLTSNAGFAISKGKFARNELSTQEGNQGPYKLIGSSGERFLIILSGTEKVYLDGEILKRGSEYDYIIDYNLAEISFTFNRLISKDSRIIVEFEYVDQSYLRSLQTAALNWKSKNSEVYFSFYNEQDSKNTLGNIDLDTADIAYLKSAGDMSEAAQRSGIKRIDNSTSSQDQVLYKKILYPGIIDSVLVHTNSLDSAKYTAYFSDVGEFNGSYRIKNETTLNGRIYEYVGPGNGRYDPVVKLVAPEQKQLYNIGGEWKVGKKTKLSGEVGMSSYDQNRFSSLGNQDNIGFASFFSFDSQKSFESEKDSSNVTDLHTTVDYEYKQDRFKELNPYRSAEFKRDWNLNIDMAESDEHFIKSQLLLQRKLLKSAYHFSSFIKPGLFQGHKHKPLLEWKYKGFSFKGSSDFLWTKSENEKTVFIRPDFELKQEIRALKNTQFGLAYKQEKNSILNTNENDSLSNSSFYFENVKLFINSRFSKADKLEFFIKHRKDYTPSGTDFESAYSATDAGISGDWNVKDNSKLKYSLSYRNLQLDTILTDVKIKPTNTILGKIFHSLNILNSFLISNFQFDLNSGQEAKSEFIFIELSNPGEGNYIWLDSNSDGIKQKGEFEAAPFSDEANYIKITQFNNEFIRVNNGILNHTLNIKPEKLLKNKKNRLAKQISKLEFMSIIRMNQKSKENENSGFSMPIFTAIEDSALVAKNTFGNFIMYYNKANPVFDIQFSSRYNTIRNIQLDGLVEYGFTTHSLTSRYSFKKNLDLIVTTQLGEKNYEAELYENKNYVFDYWEFENEFRYRFSRKAGIHLNYKYLNKENATGNFEKLQGNSLKTKINIRDFYKFNILASLSFAKYSFTGTENSSIELAMLEGLKNGNNYLWSLNLTRKMSKNIDLNLRYDGRKTGIVKTVHVASMQVKARF